MYLLDLKGIDFSEYVKDFVNVFLKRLRSDQDLNNKFVLGV